MGPEDFLWHLLKLQKACLTDRYTCYLTCIDCLGTPLLGKNVTRVKFGKWNKLQMRKQRVEYERKKMEIIKRKGLNSFTRRKVLTSLVESIVWQFTCMLLLVSASVCSTEG